MRQKGAGPEIAAATAHVVSRVRHRWQVSLRRGLAKPWALQGLGVIVAGAVRGKFLFKSLALATASSGMAEGSRAPMAVWLRPERVTATLWREPSFRSTVSEAFRRDSF